MCNEGNCAGDDECVSQTIVKRIIFSNQYSQICIDYILCVSHMYV